MIEEMLKLIEEFDSITIFGHIRPDGDCIGSQIGLKEIIKESFNKNNVYVVGEETLSLKFMGDMDNVSNDVISKSLAIIVDTATNERLYDKRALKAKEIIKIDHHLNTEQVGKYTYLVDGVSSCCEIITKIAYDNKLKINSIAANALYTGIITDSNGFKYDGTSADTLKLAAYLIEKGADLVNINLKVSEESYDALSFKGYVIEHMKKTDEGFLYCYISKKAMDEYKVVYEEASSTINVLANIIGCPVWALFLEANEGIRIRLRSNGPRIDLLANKYQGGGHKMASGAKLNSTKEIYQFSLDADEVIRKYKGGE